MEASHRPPVTGCWLRAAGVLWLDGEVGEAGALPRISFLRENPNRTPCLLNGERDRCAGCECGAGCGDDHAVRARGGCGLEELDDEPPPHPMAPPRTTTQNRTANRAFLLRGKNMKQNNAAKARPESRRPGCNSAAVVAPVLTVSVLVAADELETWTWAGLRAQVGGLAAVPVPL